MHRGGRGEPVLVPGVAGGRTVVREPRAAAPTLVSEEQEVRYTEEGVRPQDRERELPLPVERC